MCVFIPLSVLIYLQIKQFTFLGPFGNIMSKTAVRNAHLAESQAEVVAANVLCYFENKVNEDRTGAAMNFQQLLTYPSAAFYGARVTPLLSCVSLGPKDGIIVFNNLILGGIFFSVLGGLAKFIIERSKISEIRNEVWGRGFWAFGHVIANSVHVLMVFTRKPFKMARSLCSILFLNPLHLLIMWIFKCRQISRVDKPSSPMKPLFSKTE